MTTPGSRFQEVSDELICDNVLAIVKRDMKTRLDEFFEDEDLPDFAQRTLGEFVTLALPTFAISPARNDPDENDQGTFIADKLKLNLLIGVGSNDAPTVTRLAMKYIRALKSVLRSAAPQDYTAGFPANSVMSLSVAISYEYGAIGKNATGYEKMAHLELTLNLNER